VLGTSAAGAVADSPADSAAEAAPKVVVSLKPIHSLVAGVMAEVGEPVLLVKGSASLRPSDAQALSEAELVIWVGDAMESFLVRPLSTLAGDAEVITLSALPEMTLLESRRGGAWDPHVEDESTSRQPSAGRGGDEHEHAHGPGGHNLHLWLDPDNATTIVQAAVAALSRIDPDHATNYARNGDALIGRIAALDRELRADLAPVKDAPFVVFHDAYPYLEAHYGLNAVGAVTVSPERAPGAQRVSEIRGQIRALGAACVFAEPQFAPGVLATVVEGTAARQGVLDPLGADQPAGPEAPGARELDAGTMPRQPRLPQSGMP
jgi:zinc transport system substrate-binding protein